MSTIAIACVVLVVVAGFCLMTVGDQHARRSRFGPSTYFPYKWHWLPWAYWASASSAIGLYVLLIKGHLGGLGILIYAIWLWWRAAALLVSWIRKKPLELG
jgi:hypothetical protein